jgi:hypothetical protein
MMYYLVGRAGEEPAAGKRSAIRFIMTLPEMPIQQCPWPRP